MAKDYIKRMEAQIRDFESFEVLGIKLEMSHRQNRTAELWKNFRIKLKELDIHPGEFYSLQFYGSAQPAEIGDLSRSFTKMAGIRWSANSAVPDGFVLERVPAGKYAVFTEKGAGKRAAQIFGDIFFKWLPASGWLLDNRPHFEILSPDYLRLGDQAEEDICLPVKKA